MIVPDTRLQRLIDATAAAMRGARAPEPPFAKAAGEPDPAWRTRVAAAREAADAEAIARRAVIDREARRLFGSNVGDLLPAPAALTRGEFRLDVTAAGGLGDVAAELGDVAPAGSGTYLHTGTTDSVRVTVTRPAVPSRAVIVRLHGGAFWMGGGAASERVDAALIEQLASATGATVLDLDHRLAPEHPFPAAIVDVLCLLRGLREGTVQNALGHDLDPGRIALAGTSSGSNIAAVAAMADARTAPADPISALALIVPSMLLNDAPALLREDAEAWAARRRQLRAYLGDAVDAESIWASPATATVLTGMPPTFAAIAAYDEIAMGGHELCRAIAAAGTLASAREYAMAHTVALPEAEAAMIADITAFLRQHIA